ncbi:hypothetical protein ACVIEM_005642 [Rhizobium leguminosarum]
MPRANSPNQSLIERHPACIAPNRRITGSEDATEHKTPPGKKPVKEWDLNYDPGDMDEGRMR